MRFTLLFNAMSLLESVTSNQNKIQLTISLNRILIKVGFTNCNYGRIYNNPLIGYGILEG